jgi:hypothetical protein
MRVTSLVHGNTKSRNAHFFEKTIFVTCFSNKNALADAFPVRYSTIGIAITRVRLAFDVC